MMQHDGKESRNFLVPPELAMSPWVNKSLHCAGETIPPIVVWVFVIFS